MMLMTMMMAMAHDADGHDGDGGVRMPVHSLGLVGGGGVGQEWRDDGHGGGAVGSAGTHINLEFQILVRTMILTITSVFDSGFA